MEPQKGTIKAFADKNSLYERRIASIEKENKAKKYLKVTIKKSFKNCSKRFKTLKKKPKNDENQIDNKLEKIFVEKKVTKTSIELLGKDS
jgi:hypothetical protein